MAVKPVNFENQLITSKGFGAFCNSLLTDGSMTGEAPTYTGLTINFPADYYFIGGRIVRFTSIQAVELAAPPADGYITIYANIDLTKSSTAEACNQYYFTQKYSTTGDRSVTQEDINKDGTTYQCAMAVVQVTTSAITGLTWYIKKTQVPSNRIPIDIDNIYPVGSIYMSVSNAKTPDQLFGGTWSEISGKFLLSASSNHSAGTTGGAESVEYTPSGTVNGHPLTEAEMPTHSHQIVSGAYCYNTHGLPGFKGIPVDAGGSAGFAYDENSTVYTESKGSSSPHDHGFTGAKGTISTMPPFLAVYMWQRIA